MADQGRGKNRFLKNSFFGIPLQTGGLQQQTEYICNDLMMSEEVLFHSKVEFLTRFDMSLTKSF